jgi:hypothetical protein
MYCGVLVEQSDSHEDNSVSFDDRIPCSDGTCIGTIENGICTVCGKPCGEAEEA